MLKFTVAGGVGVSAIVAALAAVASSPALATDPSDVAEGMRIFQEKGGCQRCHGWSGDGHKLDNQMPDGANLRESGLNRDALVMVVKCGLPGTGMPAFDRFAYKDGRCNGVKKEDLDKRHVRLFDAPATLQPREIEILADFLVEKIVGKGALTHEACNELAGDDAEEACRAVK